MAQNATYRVYMANVGYNVQKAEVRQVLEELGVFSCSDIQVTRVDQTRIPEHCTYFLDLTDVSDSNIFFVEQFWFFLGVAISMRSFFCCYCFSLEITYLRLLTTTGSCLLWMAPMKAACAPGTWVTLETFFLHQKVLWTILENNIFFTCSKCIDNLR